MDIHSSTILVTGAAGFIGSALSMRLLDRGDKVIGIDNHNDYYDPSDEILRSFERQAEGLISKMTIEEKASHILNICIGLAVLLGRDISEI